MWKQTETLQEQFNANDDASVTFSVDPDMYTKLGIRKPKKGEEVLHDIEKIYNFQLEKDLKKLRERKGSYKARVEKFTRIRESDPAYREIAIPPSLGEKGNFNQVDVTMIDHSWQSTSKPYGVIAHKRYLEYLANLPKGPTKNEIDDKIQRNMDRELWAKVVEGRLDPTRRELKRKKYEEMRKQKKLMGEFDEDEEDEIVFDSSQLRKKAFVENNFSEMRKRPTEREYHRSMRDWHRGVHFPFNTDKGFPVLVRRNIHSVKNEEKNVVPDSKRPKSAPITSDRFIQGNYGQEKQYAEFLAQRNFDKTELYLVKEREQEEKKKLREERKKREAMLKRRRHGHQGLEIAQSVNQAKWAAMQEKFAINLTVEKVHGDDDDTLGSQGQGGLILRQSLELSSASDSSSSSGNGSGSGSEEEEEEEEDEEDSDSDSDDEEGFQDQNYKKRKSRKARAEGEEEEEEKENEEEEKADDNRRLQLKEEKLLKKFKREKTKKKKKKKNYNFNDDDHPQNHLTPSKQLKKAREQRHIARVREQSYMKQNIVLKTLFGDRAHTVDMQYYLDTLYDHVYLASDAVYSTLMPARANQYAAGGNHSNHSWFRFSRRKEEYNIHDKNNLDAHNNNNGMKKKKKEVVNVHNSSEPRSVRTVWLAIAQAPGWYYSRMKNRVGEMYEDSFLQKSLQYTYKGFHYYFLNADEVTTATQRYKHDTLKKLRHVKQEIHNHEFKEQLLQLRSDELNTDAFVKFLKRKRREINAEIQELENETRDAVNNNASGSKFQDKIAKLQLRLQYMDALEEDRRAKERVRQEMLTVAEQVLHEQEKSVEKLTESRIETYYYRVLNRIQTMKRSGLAVLDKIEKPKAHSVRLLPPPPSSSDGSYHVEVTRLLKQRIRERQRSMLLNKRLGWIVGKEEKLEDKTFTLDDLVVACVAGNYREVLDILDPRMVWDDSVDGDITDMDNRKPAMKLNLINHDHMTPLYATMLMVIRRQMVEEVINLEEMMLSSLQRLQRRLRGILLQKSDWKTPRFDLVIMILLYYGSDLNHPRCEYGQDGETILHVACKHGVTDVVEWLLQQGVDCNQLTTRDFRMPLMFAVERNHLSTAMILLRYGAVIAVNHQDRLGNTVMHIAARYANNLLTQVLLIAGAVVHKRNSEGKLPTEVAQSLNRIEIMTSMQSYRDGSIEHLDRLQFLQAMTPETANLLMQAAFGEEFGDIPDPQQLSIDTSWETLHPHSGNTHNNKAGGNGTMMNSSEKRVMKIWKPYLKGAKINPATAGTNMVNMGDIRSSNNNNDNNLDDIEGAIPVTDTTSTRLNSASNKTTTSTTSDYVTSAPRVRRTMLQLSFAKK